VDVEEMQLQQAKRELQARAEAVYLGALPADPCLGSESDVLIAIGRILWCVQEEPALVDPQEAVGRALELLNTRLGALRVVERFPQIKVADLGRSTSAGSAAMEEQFPGRVTQLLQDKKLQKEVETAFGGTTKAAGRTGSSAREPAGSFTRNCYLLHRTAMSGDIGGICLLYFRIQITRNRSKTTDKRSPESA